MRESFSGEPRAPIVDRRLNFFNIFLNSSKIKTGDKKHPIKIKQKKQFENPLSLREDL